MRFCPAARWPCFAVVLTLVLLLARAMGRSGAERKAGRILVAIPWSYSHQSASHRLGQELALRGWRIKVSGEVW